MTAKQLVPNFHNYLADLIENFWGKQRNIILQGFDPNYRGG